MSRTFLLAAVIAIAFLGMADSWYLYQSAITDTALSCDLGAALNGCNIVAQSPYSELFGVPLALYGIGFFTLQFALGIALLALSSRWLQLALYAISIAGGLASLAFLFIQFALIKAVCVYCILSALSAFALFFLSRALWKRA